MVPLRVGAQIANQRQVKAEQVEEMFSAIAPRYDLINSVLSLGLDQRWRSQAVKAALVDSPSRILDAATGTGDLALAIKRYGPRVNVVGVDLSERMLTIARRKANLRGLSITWEVGNASELSYPDCSFGAITISYGLRNLEDVDQGLNEFFRLLIPGGKLVILEFTSPPSGPLGNLVRLYSSKIIPAIGGALSGYRSAYEYLPDSIKGFFHPSILSEHIELAGFCNINYWRQFPGLSAVHIGIKPM